MYQLCYQYWCFTFTFTLEIVNLWIRKPPDNGFKLWKLFVLKKRHGFKNCSRTYPTVPLQSLHHGIVGVGIKVQTLVHLLEVQVFEGGGGLESLFAWRSPLVGGAFQVVLVVHLHGPWQHIVHHHHTDSGATELDAVQTVELWKQRSRILV